MTANETHESGAEVGTLDGKVKTLRILDPQGEPEIIKCDGFEYVRALRCKDCIYNPYHEGYVFCGNCGAAIGEYGRPNYCHMCGAKVVE